MRMCLDLIYFVISNVIFLTVLSTVIFFKTRIKVQIQTPFPKRGNFAVIYRDQGRYDYLMELGPDSWDQIIQTLDLSAVDEKLSDYLFSNLVRL